jgi:hypothetical protein
MKVAGFTFIRNAIKNLSLSIKKNKISYYTINFLRQIIPSIIYKTSLNSKLRNTNNYNIEDINNRVDYYNKLSTFKPVGEKAILLKDMPIFKSPKVYNFDTYEHTRYFNRNFKANFLFGDVTEISNVPSLQKSRPIDGDNSNAILLKLDKKRHFVFLKDNIPFSQKKDLLIGRGVITQPHRIQFMEMYFENPLCDLGQVNKQGGNLNWLKPKISIHEHLQYKFILSLEGNDVATNLKWIMSSNSIAVMPKPKFETWFMEGRLIPDYHYILINSDYSDLEQKLQYYINHTDKAEEIVRNANNYTDQFLNKQKEDVISLLVLQKYFYQTKQITEISNFLKTGDNAK